jgi:hypothetical protein
MSNTVHIDSSFLASQADIASAFARANQTIVAAGNRAFTNISVSPGDLVGTNIPQYIAAVFLKPVSSGLFAVAFNLEFALGSADTIGIAALSVLNTAIINGGVTTGTTGGLRYETTGHAISFTGGSGGPSAGGYNAVVPTPAIGFLSANIAGPISLPAAGGFICLSLATVGENTVSGMSMTALIYELP